MLEKYRPRFRQLTNAERELVWSCLRKYRPDDGAGAIGPPEDGDQLFEYCVNTDVDICAVVMSMARVSCETGRRALETIAGRPIVNWTLAVTAQATASTEATAPRHTRRASPPDAAQAPRRSARTDTRVVVSVAGVSDLPIFPTPKHKIGDTVYCPRLSARNSSSS